MNTYTTYAYHSNEWLDTGITIKFSNTCKDSVTYYYETQTSPKCKTPPDIDVGDTTAIDEFLGAFCDAKK